ncbi:cupin domain-containing protein [Bacillus sp. SB49]|uniref:cupin domain-containing protein n=1 Tax=Bacillus sp. SB49 TaxID=1071080 RepID=UPI00040C8CD6|nr:cupin domain-containing protein [Bacillus sp. SB49]
MYPNSHRSYQSPAHPSVYRQDGSEQMLNGLKNAIKSEAEAVDLYTRLLASAPSSMHQGEMQKSLEEGNDRLQQRTALYIQLAGKQPEYKIERMPFHSYPEGLIKAYEVNVRNYQMDRQQYYTNQHPTIRQWFGRVCNDEVIQANRLQTLAYDGRSEGKDFGKQPYVLNIDEATKANDTFRTAIWTGDHLQVTLMSIGVGDDVGLEIHPDVDQFLRVEEGEGLVQMGSTKETVTFEDRAYDGYAIMVPAGTWHNVINTGDKPLKLYSIYAPPQHPFGTVHQTKADALAAESGNHGSA